LAKHSVLYSGQYGFRNNHHTTMAVIDMVDNITAAMDSSIYSRCIFIELSNALDTLNHKEVNSNEGDNTQ